MKKQTWIKVVALALALSLASFFVYEKWGEQVSSTRSDLLAMMPGDASAVFFIDLSELRGAPFITQLHAWAPKPEPDPDYQQFLKGTGFDYERDLNCIAVAMTKKESDAKVFGVVDGIFDRKKISAYALRIGSAQKTSGREIFSAPFNGTTRKFSFTFQGKNRIAFTNDSSLDNLISPRKQDEETARWRVRFDRLGGSPLFVVIRQNTAASRTWSSLAPGGFHSPQLSTLLDQLKWITFAGKLENDRLRIIAEGEAGADSTARQLSDMLNGIVLLAEAGLNDSNARDQLDPAARQSYMEVLKSVQIDRLDRGETKSVRVVFEIAGNFLNAARLPSFPAPGSAPVKPKPGQASASKKGHT